MNIMDMRVVITVLCFLCFLGIFLWAYSSRQKPRFDEAANLPFADDDMQERTVNHLRNTEKNRLFNRSDETGSVKEPLTTAPGEPARGGVNHG